MEGFLVQKPAIQWLAHETPAGSETELLGKKKTKQQKVISLAVAGLLSLGTTGPVGFLNAENNKR